MKYLVLRRRPEGGGNLFLERACASSADDDPVLPVVVRTADVSEGEAADLRRDPAVEDVIPSMPLSLIAPVASGANATPPERGWV